MDLRADRFVKRFAPFLPETEGADVVDIAARRPALAEVALAHYQQTQPAELLRRVAAIRRAAILDAVEYGVEIRARTGFAAEIDVVRKASRGEILHAVGDIVTAA